MSTAKEMPTHFDSMTNNPAPAVFANRRDCLNGAFETIECVSGTRCYQFECLIVFISTNFAFGHLPPHPMEMAIRCPTHER